MCIIAIKPAGVKMPPNTYIENMWYHNSDGAGYMYANGSNVIIQKGFMTLVDFNKSLEKLAKSIDLTETALVMHFRIGTAGGNIPANTHPFPVTDSVPMLQKLSCTTSLGVAHNGIISITPREKTISDTMEWIAAELAPLYRYDKEFCKHKDILQMLGARTKSKLAFLTPDGKIYTVGPFVEENGILYSNTTYSYSYYYRNSYARYYGYSDYDYGDYEDKKKGSYPEEWDLEIDQYVDKLMMLSDEDYVIDYETGFFYGADDFTFFIDRDNFVYVYDDFLQCACAVANEVAAFTKEGLSVKFDPDKAADMLVDNQEFVDLNDYADKEEAVKPLTEEEIAKAKANKWWEKNVQKLEAGKTPETKDDDDDDDMPF